MNMIEQIKATDKPWWYPVKTDAAWIERLRNDYPESTAGKTDDEVRSLYDGDNEFATTWDHLGDAYEEYEYLANVFLDMEAALIAADELAYAAESLMEYLRAIDDGDSRTSAAITAYRAAIGAT